MMMIYHDTNYVYIKFQSQLIKTDAIQQNS